MSVIPGPISTQNFELIRDRVAEILADELGQQHQYTYDNLFLATVFMERYVPLNQSEYPAVNLCLDNILTSNQDQTQGDFLTRIYINTHTKSSTSLTKPGDMAAVKLNHRLAGMCRAILEDSRYKTLGFAPGLIKRRWVSEMQFAPAKVEDNVSTVHGRVIFNVLAGESNGLAVPSLLSEYYTSVKINESDQGYYYLSFKTV